MSKQFNSTRLHCSSITIKSDQPASTRSARVGSSTRTTYWVPVALQYGYSVQIDFQREMERCGVMMCLPSSFRLAAAPELTYSSNRFLPLVSSRCQVRNLDTVSRTPLTHSTMAAMISAPLALGARAAVRGAKVHQKETSSVKIVRSAARAELSKGEWRPRAKQWRKQSCVRESPMDDVFSFGRHSNISPCANTLRFFSSHGSLLLASQVTRPLRSPP